MSFKQISSAGSTTCVIVLTSEPTWEHLRSYCFNSFFIKNRTKFDLCIAFNGIPSAEASMLLSSQQPEHVIIRPNHGMDPAALDECIKNIPLYNFYIVLHDDHWFSHDAWLEQLLTLMQTDATATAYGNLVTSCPYKSQAFDTFFEMVSTVTGYEDYHISEFSCYLQGMAGIFRGSAIKQLLALDGVPHTHGNNKKVVEVCERLLSYLLLNNGAVLKQIPPGYELYLRHRDHNKAAADGMLAPPFQNLTER